MSRLTITSSADLGPLQVSVVPQDDGDPIEFTLSSGKLRHEEPLEPGRYAVIARRPNGNRLGKTVVVTEDGYTLDLSQQVRGEPSGMLIPEVRRGYLAVGDDIPGPNASSPMTSGHYRLLGANATAMWAATLGASGGPSAHFKTTWFPSQDFRIPAAGAVPLELQLWQCVAGRWRPAVGGDDIQARLHDGFLKVTVQPRAEVRALGLIAGARAGPIVMLAPFVEPQEITFLAHGLETGAADRNQNPGGVRTPVALATPSQPAAADLLTALASPGGRGAADLWDQTAQNLAPGPHQTAALDILTNKFQRPAEATLAAHFLLRFMPAKLPHEWAANLCHALPMAADGPVIAAWSLIAAPPPPKRMSAKRLNEQVASFTDMALQRPATLFARTRSLLVDLLALTARQGSDRRKDQTLAFHRFGASAGGLECFWGAGPSQPGVEALAPPPGGVLMSLGLHQARFVTANEMTALAMPTEAAAF